MEELLKESLKALKSLDELIDYLNGINFQAVLIKRKIPNLKELVSELELYINKQQQ